MTDIPPSRKPKTVVGKGEATSSGRREVRDCRACVGAVRRFVDIIQEKTPV